MERGEGEKERQGETENSMREKDRNGVYAHIYLAHVGILHYIRIVSSIRFCNVYLLDIIQMGLSREGLKTMLRYMISGNPWGNSEWNGDWSDYSADGNGSAKWKKNPQLCAKLDPKKGSILDLKRNEKRRFFFFCDAALYRAYLGG